MSTFIRLALPGEETTLARVHFEAFSTPGEPWKAFKSPRYAAHEDYAIAQGVKFYEKLVRDRSVACAVFADGGQEKIVGVASWRLPGKEEVVEEKQELNPGPEGYEDAYRIALVNEQIGPLKGKYFHNHVRRSGIVVLPACHRRGIATHLLRFIEPVSVKHNLPIAVVATSRSAPVHAKLGYTTVAQVMIRDERPGHEASLELFLQEWVSPDEEQPSSCENYANV